MKGSATWGSTKTQIVWLMCTKTVTRAAGVSLEAQRSRETLAALCRITNVHSQNMCLESQQVRHTRGRRQCDNGTNT